MKALGTATAVIGAGFDAHNAGAAFGSGDVGQGVSRTASAGGSVASIWCPPLAIGVVGGNLLGSAAEGVYGTIDSRRNRQQLQADEALLNGYIQRYNALE